MVFSGKTQYELEVSLLIGTSCASLDNKGRLSIPVRYRPALCDQYQGQCVCTIDLNYPCLLLYPLPEWRLIEAKLSHLSSMNEQERRILRLLLGHASELQIDHSGRILLPLVLRKHAQLDKSIMLVGQLNKFELWNEEKWHEQVSHDLDSISSDQVSERLQDLSL